MSIVHATNASSALQLSESKREIVRRRKHWSELVEQSLDARVASTLAESRAHLWMQLSKRALPKHARDVVLPATFPWTSASELTIDDAERLYQFMCKTYVSNERREMSASNNNVELIIHFNTQLVLAQLAFRMQLQTNQSSASLLLDTIRDLEDQVNMYKTKEWERHQRRRLELIETYGLEDEPYVSILSGFEHRSMLTVPLTTITRFFLRPKMEALRAREAKLTHRMAEQSLRPTARKMRRLGRVVVTLERYSVHFGLRVDSQQTAATLLRRICRRLRLSENEVIVRSSEGVVVRGPRRLIDLGIHAQVADRLEDSKTGALRGERMTAAELSRDASRGRLSIELMERYRLETQLGLQVDRSRVDLFPLADASLAGLREYSAWKALFKAKRRRFSELQVSVLVGDGDGNGNGADEKDEEGDEEAICMLDAPVDADVRKRKRRRKSARKAQAKLRVEKELRALYTSRMVPLVQRLMPPGFAVTIGDDMRIKLYIQ